MLPLRITAATITLALLACGTDAAEPGSSSDATDPDREAVTAAYQYLYRYGYFPNEELAAKYPSWRPAVTEAPSEPGVFDERMRAAVLRAQRQLGLQETGLLDAPTRAAFQRPRCGVPDGEHVETHEKFAREGTFWNRDSLTWRVVNGDNDTVSREQARAAARSAFGWWAAVTSLAFFERDNDSNVDITITFGGIDGPGNVVGVTGYPTQGGDMTLDTGEKWSMTDPPPTGFIDLQTAMMHELGHALGLLHSSISGATMAPLFPVFDRNLLLDDAVGISSLYDKWEQAPGRARDIGAAHSSFDLWMVGWTLFAGGYTVHKWDGSDWVADNFTAVRIAVEPNGIPWAINSNGNIFRRDSAASGNVNWTQLPGTATDIAAGGGKIWITSREAFGDGYRVKVWNGTGWDNANGGAIRIAVDTGGTPWVVDSDGEIFRGNSNVAGTSFTQLPGCAKDIGIGAGNYAWILGCTSVPGGGAPHVWNEQPQGSVGTQPAPSRRGWIKMAGGATQVTVSMNARPWFANSDGWIYRAIR